MTTSTEPRITRLIQPRLIKGYHGTTVERVARIREIGFDIRPSSRHWLGRGAYFFQDAPGHAWKWARWAVSNRNRGTQPAVVEASIDITACVDLCQIEWLDIVGLAHEKLKAKYSNEGKALPPQEPWKPGIGQPHPLDCAVIEDMVMELERGGYIYTTVRGIFWEGDPVFPTSHFHDGAHVSIAARTNSAIHIDKYHLLDTDNPGQHADD